MDLATTYLNLHLKNPLLVGASPLAYDLGDAKRLEDAGTAAIVLHSLFAEQIIRGNIRGAHESRQDGLYKEATGFPLDPDAYVEHLAALKDALSIPIIASLNGNQPGSWLDYARLIENAGADALEVNLYQTPHCLSDPSQEIEKATCAMVRDVCRAVSIPVGVKLSPFYTGLPRFLTRLKEAGAEAAILFNGCFQPDMDIDRVAYKPEFHTSDTGNLLLRTSWIAALYGRTDLELCLSGGIRSAEDMIKALMSGATTVQVVSMIIRDGPGSIRSLLEELQSWLEAREYVAIDQLRGILSFDSATAPGEMARAAYLETLQNWGR